MHKVMLVVKQMSGLRWEMLGILKADVWVGGGNVWCKADVWVGVGNVRHIKSRRLGRGG